MRSHANSYLFLALAFAACGCATPPRRLKPQADIREPTPSTAPATQPVIFVAPGKILITFDKFDCYCRLAGVEQSLLDLRGVGGLQWDVAEYKVLLDGGDPPATDEQIRNALEYSGVTISRINRP